MKAQKTIATFLKFMAWTVAAAAVKWALDNLGAFTIPDYYVPLLAALLKSLATWIATESGK